MESNSINQMKADYAVVSAACEKWAAPAWTPITGPGQVQKGDRLRFTIGDKLYSEKAKLILLPSTDKEEVVYDIGRNFYFITSMVVGGRSNHKGVEVLRSAAQPAPTDAGQAQALTVLRSLAGNAVGNEATINAAKHLISVLGDNPEYLAQCAAPDERLRGALQDIADACNCCGDRADLSAVAAEALASLAAPVPAAAPEPLQGWISVDAGMPDNEVDVLVWERWATVPFIGSRRHDDWHANIEFYEVHGDGVVSDRIAQGDVTHWMPLPAAPAPKGG